MRRPTATVVRPTFGAILCFAILTPPARAQFDDLTAMKMSEILHQDRKALEAMQKGTGRRPGGPSFTTMRSKQLARSTGGSMPAVSSADTRSGTSANCWPTRT
jgi:hypothetical protein